MFGKFIAIVIVFMFMVGYFSSAGQQKALSYVAKENNKHESLRDWNLNPSEVIAKQKGWQIWKNTFGEQFNKKQGLRELPIFYELVDRYDIHNHEDDSYETKSIKLKDLGTNQVVSFDYVWLSEDDRLFLHQTYLRNWTISNIKVTGTLVGLNETYVVLRNIHLNEIKIPLKKFSLSDQKFLVSKMPL